MKNSENISNKKKHAEPEKRRKGVLIILGEFRTAILTIILVLGVFSTIAFLFKDFVFNELLFAPGQPSFWTNRTLCELSHKYLSSDILCLNQHPLTFSNLELAGQFNAHIFASFLLGLMVSFPIIIVLLWRVIKQFFSDRIKGKGNVILFFVSILFSIGVLFGYFIIMPLTLDFLGGYSISSEVTNNITFASYMSVFSSVTLASGFVFELPIIIIFLSKVGLVNRSKLRKFRKVALVIFLTISAIITPPDLFSQILVALPLLLLYELSILLAQKER